MAAFLTSSQELLFIISGHSSIKSKDLIKEELNANKTRLLDGILVYKAFSPESEAKLKADKTVGHLEQKFLCLLSKFLDLDAQQCQELYNCYLQHAFRGTGSQLQSILKDDRSIQALILKVCDFYRSERLHLIHAVKLVIKFCQDTEHPYQGEYYEFIEDLQGKDLFGKLVAQYKNRFETPAPEKQTHTPLMTERQKIRWCVQCLREQVEILEIILLYLHGHDTPSDYLLTVTKLFQRQGFGTRQPYRYLLDNEEIAKQLTQRIGFLCSIVVIECLDLYSLMDASDESSINSHKLIQDKHLSEEFGKLLHSLGNAQPHAPILISWMAICALSWPPEQLPRVKVFGQKALNLQVFGYLDTELKSMAASNDRAVPSLVAHSVTYALVSLLLSTFQEESLGSTRDLTELFVQLLSQPHLCQEFWTADFEGSQGSLLHASIEGFPFEFSPLMNVATSLATEGSKRIFKLFSCLPTFLESLDNNRAEDIENVRNGRWRLERTKLVAKEGERSLGFSIPAGTEGQLINRPQKHAAPLIKWEVEYDAWQLFACLVDWLIQTAQQGSVTEIVVNEVRDIINLVAALLESSWSLHKNLQPITDSLGPLLSSLSSLHSPPLQLIAGCLKCLSVIARQEPQKVWQTLQDCGFFPQTGNLYTDVDLAVSGEGVFPGDYGKLLQEKEQPHGQYHITKAFLDTLQTLVKGFSNSQVSVAVSQDLLACIVFTQRHIFSTFQKWRYADFTDKDEIGLKTLEVFHQVLNVVPIPVANSLRKQDDTKTSITVLDACVYGLLNTTAGEALLSVAATGLDSLEQRLMDNGSSMEGSALEMCQQIKLSLSVLNRLLLLKLPGQPPCPLEEALTSHTTGLPHQPHLVAVIAGYIYHRLDPKLPTLATLFLRRLAVVAPMSLYGCLGNQAPAVRDMFISRLQNYVEDTRLKVGILDLLTQAVESQPGLSELFLNLQSKKKEEGGASKESGETDILEMEISKTSILNTILELLDDKRQGTTHCPPDFHCSALGFLQALWQDRREIVMSLLRVRENFWRNITLPLFNDLPEVETGKISGSEVKIRAHALKLIALECYHMESSEKLTSDFKKILEDLGEKQRLTYWSQYLCDLLQNSAKRSDHLEEYTVRDHEALVMLQAWRTVLIVSSLPKGHVLKLTTKATRGQILDHLMTALQSQAERMTSVFHAKVYSLLSSTYLSLLSKWKSSLNNKAKHIDLIVSGLQNVADLNPTQLVQRCIANSLAILTRLLHVPPEERVSNSVSTLDGSRMEFLLPTICALIRDSSQFYTKQEITKEKRGRMKSSSSGVLDVTMEDPEKCLSVTTKQPVGETQVNNTLSQNLPVLATYLLDEVIILFSSNQDGLLTYLREFSLIPILLSTVQACIEARAGLHYIEGVLSVFLDLSSQHQCAEALQIGGLNHHLTLSLINTYQKTNAAAAAAIVTPVMWNSNNMKDNVTPPTTQPTWLGIYRVAVSVMTTMLSTLKHHFLSDALDFVGVHKERMLYCLQVAHVHHSQSCLQEAEATSAFICQLASFSREWRLHMPEVVSEFLLTMGRLCQSCMALLIRPRLLQYLIEQHSKSEDGRQPHQMIQFLNSAPSRLLQHQVSTSSDISESEVSPEIMKIQARLVVILTNTLVALLRVSPPLIEALLNQSLDVTEYPVLFELSFSTPDMDQSSPPSFGCLLSCINWCLQLLPKVDSGVIKITSMLPKTRPESPGLRRERIIFLMENAVHLIMAQGMRILREPSVDGRDRQLLKRELSSELNNFLVGLHRYFRRGSLVSPRDASPRPGTTRSTPGKTLLRSSSSHTSFTESDEQRFYKAVQTFVQETLK
ncbi:hypothetical protein HOLleu_16255 [Holothuria leucospilota]|uniref:Nucleoporin NUP188 n=1 Tax=Holothuria leucospilota TaxID=206669 RepID=A0A9Q1HAH6_HOLLE|nr:hypothetical protein HOLleu_16255 [Holothuria leucospilota]